MAKNKHLTLLDRICIETGLTGASVFAPSPENLAKVPQRLLEKSKLVASLASSKSLTAMPTPVCTEETVHRSISAFPVNTNALAPPAPSVLSATMSVLTLRRNSVHT